jgi:beta-lactam-binding protein with PASTA domain
MNRLLRLALLGLILVLVGLVSALTAMRIAIHGREVKVPALTGLTPMEAEGLLLDKGLRLELENRFYSVETPEGRIMSQLPIAGAVVRRGWRVRMAESMGTPRARVPNVIGESRRSAEINLRRRGLEVGKVAVVHLPGASISQVVAMSPPPQSVSSSPKVSLLLTAAEESGSLVMPNLIGKSLADGAQLVDRSGLRLAGPRLPSRGSRATVGRLIVKQFPLPGSKVRPGTAVRLELFR